ncbi:16S rRNA (uracil(1498)-N(3))-methyltransferase [Geitlerinema sp. PCC 9228]|uniref:16S rRNA (uracil(1498)-N(3))-methyltransferase n=1 Tax=Geitlerinema sp. PCC 9228 TaxID=111611 RepID=UPI0008F9AA52|nr:16S rRNA (uracil(1498)-N(3))-methyltransferase [Geitlerinema sp. PCC 9228]
MQLQRIAIAPSQVRGNTISLTPHQQHYLYRVLRCQRRDRFIAMDGGGNWWLSQLTGDSQAEIVEFLDANNELPVAVTLAAAMPKGSGFEEIVRYSTELGVTRIVPLQSDRTLLQPSAKKRQRWQRIAAEAAEQSERQMIPEITEPLSLAAYCSTVSDTIAISHRLVAVARADVPHLAEMIPVSGEIAIATGPEGGWCDRETICFQEYHFQPVSLGKRILRAVTAPLVALSAIAAACESGK